MAKILEMPKLSPTMEEGVLLEWHKNEGDAVEVDDLLAEVETDKATMEFRAFDKGVLLKQLVPANSSVKLGQPVAILGKEGEDVSELVAQAGGGGGGEDEARAEPAAAKEAPKAKKAAAKPADEAPAEAEADEPEADEPEADEPEADDEPAADDEPEADEPEPEPEPEAKTEKPGAPKKDAEPKKAAPKPKGDVDEKTKPEPKPVEKPAAPTKAMPKGSLLDRTQREGDHEGAAPEGGRVLASPYVRKQARERGIDLSSAQGSGEHGRIVPSDLDSLATGGPASATKKPADKAEKPTSTQLAKTDSTSLAAPAPASHGSASGLAQPEVRKLSPMRKVIARRLTESKQTVPHFYLTIDVDAAPVLALRESINADLASQAAKSGNKGAEAPKPEKISVNDLLIKAIASALQRVPECNAQFTPEALLIHTRIDISVAVAIPDGLVTPVVRNADQKSVVAIAREVRDLAARARVKKLKPEEMTDGTFSISNLGMFGIDEFSAVINPPEGAILAVGAARDEPVVKDGQVVAGKKMAMTLSCDHRVIDGAVGAAFLAELRSLLEHPMRILSG